MLAPRTRRNVGTLAHEQVAFDYGTSHLAPTNRAPQARTISFITRVMVTKCYRDP